MASTNKTSNYELSQFLGTDKPAWLSDYNQDMTKIDTQMKANADGVTSASGSASSANTKIGTLASLTTDVKTDVVSAINEVDSHADSAQNTANSATSTATSASTTANGLQSYLNINSFTTYTASNMSIVSGGGTLGNANITVARNSEGSLCKIYGYIVVSGSTGSSFKVKITSDTGLDTDSKLTITGTGVIENFPQDYGLSGLNIDINTDGTIEFYGSISSNDTTYVVRPFACVIFVKNFGDQPE